MDQLKALIENLQNENRNLDQALSESVDEIHRLLEENENLFNTLLSIIKFIREIIDGYREGKNIEPLLDDIEHAIIKATSSRGAPDQGI